MSIPVNSGTMPSTAKKATGPVKGHRSRSSDDPGVQMSGWLVKKGRRMLHNWRTRWFVLNGTTLTYYRFEHGVIPRGEVTITNSTTCNHCGERPFCFTVTIPDRGTSFVGEVTPSTTAKKSVTLYMVAPDNSQLNRWMDAIHSAISLAKIKAASYSSLSFSDDGSAKESMGHAPHGLTASLLDSEGEDDDDDSEDDDEDHDDDVLSEDEDIGEDVDEGDELRLSRKLSHKNMKKTDQQHEQHPAKRSGGVKLLSSLMKAVSRQTSSDLTKQQQTTRAGLGEGSKAHAAAQHQSLPHRRKHHHDRRQALERAKSERMERPKVVLKIIRAENLLPMDRNGFSDPYVVVKFGSQSTRTKTVLKNLNPVWDEVFTFDYDRRRVKMLELEVWDADVMDSDDFIGRAVIPLLPVSPNKPIASWFELCARTSGATQKHRFRGRIAISLETNVPMDPFADALLEQVRQLPSLVQPIMVPANSLRIHGSASILLDPQSGGEPSFSMMSQMPFRDTEKVWDICFHVVFRQWTESMVQFTRGLLVITNYRLCFVPYESIESQTEGTITVPLGLITNVSLSLASEREGFDDELLSEGFDPESQLVLSVTKSHLENYSFLFQIIGDHGEDCLTCQKGALSSNKSNSSSRPMSSQRIKASSEDRPMLSKKHSSQEIRFNIALAKRLNVVPTFRELLGARVSSPLIPAPVICHDSNGEPTIIGLPPQLAEIQASLESELPLVDVIDDWDDCENGPPARRMFEMLTHIVLNPTPYIHSMDSTHNEKVMELKQEAKKQRASKSETEREDGSSTARSTHAVSIEGPTTVMEAEMQRLGVPDALWRATDVNKHYELCPTYPAYIIVPSSIDDATLLKVKGFRSKGRIPALTWLNRSNGMPLCRCAQPLVGVASNRSVEDEAMLAAIQSNGLAMQRYAEGHAATKDRASAKLQHVSDFPSQQDLDASDGDAAVPPIVVIDARPKLNATANNLKGGGTEVALLTRSNSPIPSGTFHLEFMDIANIHTMRKSVDTLKQIMGSETNESKLATAIDSTGWLSHIKQVLGASVYIVLLLHYHRCAVLVHCSDGWDRTSQLSSLPQVMLDPYFRTMKGFCVLVEKDWLSFGHKFHERNGHEKPAERSPIFQQFIEAVYQILRQYPDSFEFHEEFLLNLLEHSKTGWFATFYGNCEKDRRDRERSQGIGLSLWGFLLANAEYYRNPSYKPSPEDVDPVIPSMSMKDLHHWDLYWSRHTKQVHTSGWGKLLSASPYQCLRSSHLDLPLKRRKRQRRRNSEKLLSGRGYWSR